MSRDSNYILAEQLRLLFAALPLSLAGSVVNALILAAVLWEVAPHAGVLIWLGVILLVTAVRAVFLYHFRHKPPRNEHEQQTYSKQLLFSSLLVGLTWGSVSVFLFPAESVPHQAFIAFVMAGNSAAAIIGLSYIWQAAMAFVIPALLPLIVQLFLLQTSMSTAMGTMASLFLLIAISGIKRTFENNRQNITLRMESAEHEKTILESQQKLALHVQQTPLAVIEWSTDFKVTAWNPAAEKIFAYSKTDAMGKHATDLIVPDEIKPQIDDIWASLLQQKGGLHNTNENVTKDGRRISCEWYNTPLVDKQGQVIGVASLALDITERMRIEQLQNEFISTVSHELRTPLTSVRGTIGLLSGDAILPEEKEYKHLLKIANTNIERLLLIINDILDIQKIESGKMEFDFQPVALQSFLKQAIESNQNYADQYQVSFLLQPTDDDLIVRADHNRLMQVMYNLLSNAAKFSQPGQQVDVELQRHNGMGRIVISDHGEGIDEAFVEHVFERFTRSDNTTTRHTGGTGLGLSIAKNIIDQHAGAISFETQMGRGTRFYVDLPLTQHM